MPIVNDIQFSIVSPAEIKAFSVCEVTTSALKGNEPNSLYDLRMGPANNIDSCQTCGMGSLNCVGHFGFIQLASPVFHCKWVKILHGILRCICQNCSSSLITKDQAQLYNLLKFKRERRLKAMIKMSEKIRMCPKEDCRAAVPKYRLKENKIMYYYEKEKMADLSAETVYNIMRKITNEDFQLLGFNYELGTDPVFTDDRYLLEADMLHRHQTRPEWFLLTVLPVLPPCTRPSIQEETERLDDHFVDLYTRIIKNNNKLKESKENSLKKNSEEIFAGGASGAGKRRGRRKPVLLTEKEYKDCYLELDKCIKALIDNRDGKLKLPNSQPHKGLNERISSKDGIVRKHIQGKRVDFSCRTVAGGDPTLMVDEIAVPEWIAARETMPEKVANFNKSWLKELIAQNRVNFIIRKHRKTGETTKFSIQDKRNKTMLENVLAFEDLSTYEYIVERHLQDKDWTALNRQPTLRVEGISGCKIVVRKGKTIRVNLAVTTSLNMDFNLC